MRVRRAIILATAHIAVMTATALLPLAEAASQTATSQTERRAVRFNSAGELTLPQGYRNWLYLGSPLTPHALNGGAAPFPEFHNVYIEHWAFNQYRKTGKFPEGTMMVKELQLTQPSQEKDGSSVEVSGRGYFPGAFNGLDVSVKDTRRFKDTNGWGYFNFGHHAPPYEMTAKERPIDACAGCHIASATKDMVFTKFYRVLDVPN